MDFSEGDEVKTTYQLAMAAGRMVWGKKLPRPRRAEGFSEVGMDTVEILTELEDTRDEFLARHFPRCLSSMWRDREGERDTIYCFEHNTRGDFDAATGRNLHSSGGGSLLRQLKQAVSATG